MKKILWSIGVLGVIMVILGSASAFDFSFGYQRNGTEAIKSIKNISVGGVEADQEDSLLDVIRDVTNRVLGILGLIALIILLYGGFLMIFSAGNDDEYSKGWSIMKSAIIGLIIIGVTWFIVSLIIWFSQRVMIGADGAQSDQ